MFRVKEECYKTVYYVNLKICMNKQNLQINMYTCQMFTMIISEVLLSFLLVYLYFLIFKNKHKSYV